jgi:hypothetical protein
MWKNNSEFRIRVVGTSGGDDRTFPGVTRNQTHLMSFQYNGFVRSGTVNGVSQTMNDTGIIPNNPNADFVIGGAGRDQGTPASASKSRISEVLIFKDALPQVEITKMEGYLAHKWGLTNRLKAGHTYTGSTPSFADPIDAVDLTLYWGSNDGAENPAGWENEVALGRFYKEQVDVNGFNAYGYQSTYRNDSYLRNIETLRSASADQTTILRGEPDNPVSNGMYFDGTADFINAGVIKNTNNNLGWEDNFMTLFTTKFKAPTTGNYQLKWIEKMIDTRCGLIWIRTEYLKAVPEPMDRQEMKSSIQMAEALRISTKTGLQEMLPSLGGRNISWRLDIGKVEEGQEFDHGSRFQVGLLW